METPDDLHPPPPRGTIPLVVVVVAVVVFPQGFFEASNVGLSSYCDVGRGIDS